MREVRLGPLLANFQTMEAGEWACFGHPPRWHRWATVIVADGALFDDPPAGYTSLPDGGMVRDRDGRIVHPDMNRDLIMDVAVNLAGQTGRDLDIRTFIRGVRHYHERDTFIEFAPGGRA